MSCSFLDRTIQSNLCRLSQSPVPSISGHISPLFFSTAKMNSDKNGASAILFGQKRGSSSCGKIEQKRYLGKRRKRIDVGPKQMAGEDEFSLSTEFGKNVMPPPCVKGSKCGQRYSKEKYPVKVEPFDICFSTCANSGLLNASLYEKDGPNRNNVNVEGIIEGTKQGVLRPGMILLKNYITHNSQVQIVKTCRELGLSPGGFYRPGYQDGAKLRLQMMCLGLNWDPQTRNYEDERPVDGCKPHDIPCEFNLLVTRAIQDAHALIRQEFNLSNAEDMLPTISPNICIVNFYTINGRLGLHQDRDESTKSLQKGLPVVSFSVGDSAEFLYGDQRDVDKATKIVLESGDVLIFGGKSRHIFHGVTSIIPNSAPKALVEESGLRPGRLNLTFRRY